MKTEFLLTLSLLGAGCQSANPPPKSVSLLPRSAMPTASAGLRVPETIRTYAVGAYVDPDDESVRHDAHLIHRIEKPSRWNLAPAVPEPASPLPAPVTLTPLPLPAPILTPLLPPTLPLAPSVTPVPPTPSLPAPPIAVAVAPTAAPEPALAIESVLTPNADGVIDLAAVEPSLSDDDANPFALRAQTPAAFREINLRVSGVFLGAISGALVNDRPLLIGESADSLTLVRVEPDAAVFRADTRQLRAPVSGKPVLIRLAR